MDEDDLPVAHTFAEQKSERKVSEKRIGLAISESRKRSKEARKIKHAEKSTKKSSLLPEDEFNLSTNFNPVAHIPSTHDVNARKTTDLSTTRKIPASEYTESDEGYTGSDEQDRWKNAQAVSDNHERLHAGDLSLVGHLAGMQKKPNTSRRAGLRKRKSGYEGAFRVQRLDKLNVENHARLQAETFFKQHLFAPLSRQQYKDINRMDAHLLVSLTQKRKARTKR
ncbi:hypothetical protein EG68_09007 [Paragonimus skrjabini miyazakii]|uniref:Uncharacterized protein n=1 Tax=Paragonimus skrjabini miyazakii TaxID=59628 RepID=A0A8S9YMH1_9TREM|nr:hypothetical protein EG68_09007 [Paragonimus skrjabini miyazakii]